MPLQFIGEIGVYMADRDAIKIVALAGDSVVDCYVTRSALDAIGAGSREPMEIIKVFETRRIDCEIAAIVKFRRATAATLSIEVLAEDLAAVDNMQTG